MPDVMRAAVLHGIGEVPRYGEFPAPVAGAGEAVVTVGAAALKPFDRWWAEGLHPASPTVFPQVVGADGVGRLDDGTRVAFFGPVTPYGGMAERALVRRGLWFPVRAGVDDVTAAALLNPGGAAWKTVVWEGGAGPGKTVLVLGATGASGRIAVQVAKREGARVVAAGRDRSVLDALGADAVVRLDRPKDEVVDAITAHGPYDLVVDYLWGAPAEAAFAALSRGNERRVRYILVGMSAGATAEVPAMALRAARVEVIGGGTGGSPSIEEAAAAFDRMLGLVAEGEIVLDAEAVPLADIEDAWTRPENGRRTVLVL
ncbi:quinone oxidoreductase family protein [Actinomadura opuntiae]|uniref:quinone oxidoreductase family protein n=1 Tax=Actinomadura sp. OS1-43 TaxID=604315 RepID=UPI00255B21CE|nr:zinc-binding dehydrogenase [Actinomadura sp. OS1-43]MDL4817982.1 zinc-binding dehydrogenase [Actinomadura sp. OS1-43]